MPDRFANGDTKNDSLSGFFQGVHRDQPFGRHGGDLKGISDHLDYIKRLGVTAIWLNPVLENNQKRESYHGYAITDLYKVDQRFGSNDDYLDFINKSHTLGLKVIQDMVMNHIGNMGWLVKDLPSKNWIHQFPTHTASNYRSTVIMDPYRSSNDEKIMSDGWFDTTMADVNQQDPLFAKYLIQNSIWWIEYAGIDGIRMDTYPYPDKNFMSRWCKELLTQYPSFNIVGEVWINDVAGTAYWQSGVKNADGYQSLLPSVTDFPLYFAMEKAFTEPAGWNNGLTRLYELLGRDFSYTNPQTNVIFIDNHDTPRFFHTVGKDLNKLKMAWVFLLTTRGIPQLYYGTEILEDGDYSIHPTVRRDFPGGWDGDVVNAFSGSGITLEQQEAMAYLKKLLSWRKQKEVIHTGKLRHYIPKDNVYVYFRYNEQGEVIMVVLNGNDKPMSVATDRFSEAMSGKKHAKNPLTGEVLNNIDKIVVAPFTALILELE
jgi:glycosidase